MPLVSHQVLYWSTMVAALVGQFMLDTNPKPAILICGAALVLALLDGWWYLSPIGSNWWYPALFGVLGLTMWQEPRGWFFMAWAAVTIGTGLRWAPGPGGTTRPSDGNSVMRMRAGFDQPDG